MTGLKMRQAVPSDLGEMQKLFSDTVATICMGDYSRDQIDAWISAAENKDRWLDKIARQFFLIVEMNENMVGYGSLDNGHYLDFLYVHKDYQRQGIAKFVLCELEKEAARLGVTEISSDVSKTAVLFFRHNGFTVIKENRNTINNVEIINFKMVKKL